MSNCSTPASLHQVGFALQTQSPRQVEGPQALLSMERRAADAQCPQTQPCNVTSSSASWLFSPKVLQPTAEACIYHNKRAIKRKGLRSDPQTGKNHVSSAAIYSLRFIKPSFVPILKLHQTKAVSHPQHCLIFKLGQMHWTLAFDSLHLFSAPTCKMWLELHEKTVRLLQVIRRCFL